MALILRRIYDFMVYSETLVDKRTEHLPLVNSKITPFLLVALYVYFVRHLGPSMMRHRKPFNLKYTLIVYNALQIALSAFILIEGTRVMYDKLNWRCVPFDRNVNAETEYIGFLFWVYYMVKIVDLLDTIFFVLKKNDRQITFLHVYHHGGMVLLVWGCTRYIPGGHACYVGLINGFVHANMYFYYLLTAINPKFKRIIGLKKYITQIQLIQFVLFTFLYMQVLIRSCDFPLIPTLLFIPQNLFMSFMFGEFYYRTYIKKKQ